MKFEKPHTKRFIIKNGNRNFQYLGSYGNKKNAKQFADKKKKLGLLIRIVKIENGYKLYGLIK